MRVRFVSGSASARSLATVACVAIALTALALPVPAAAQRAPAFGGVEARVGVVSPARATVAAAIIGEVDLGYLWRPELRVIAGLSHFSANIDREPGDDEGSFGATGFWLGGRYDLFALQQVSGYVRTSVVVHRVAADAWDSDVDALLSGTNVGAALAVGARRALDNRGRLNGTVEVRHTAVNNIANTAVEIGVRLLRRGTLSYVPQSVALAPSPLYEPRRPDRAADVVPPAAMPVPPVDTAAARREAEARRTADDAAEARAAEAARAADLAERRAREALAEQRAAESLAERALAAESMLRQGLDRAAAAMTSVSSVAETPQTFVVTVGGTAFGSGASGLSRAARAELRVLATVLAGYPGHIVTVEGHTDAVGDAAANLALSLERAGAVRAGLIVEGVDPLWTALRGQGAARPVASNDTAAGRAANRRVEIQVARRPCDEPPRRLSDGGLVCPGGPALP